MISRPLEDRCNDGRECEIVPVIRNQGGYYKFCLYLPQLGVKRCGLSGQSCKYARPEGYGNIVNCAYGVNKR